MKANFQVDPDFPIIDGVGHSDKIDFFDVKGGGCTNTTLLDPLSDSDLHVFHSVRPFTAVATDLASSRLDPTWFLNGAAAPLWHNANLDCLNAPYVADNYASRNGDQLLMSRIEVSGSVVRPASSSTDDYEMFPSAPKCFVALVLDRFPDGAVPPTVCFSVNDQVSNNPFDFGGAFQWGGSGAPTSNVPFVSPSNRKRYRVLAYDVLDFSLSPETRYDWVDQLSTWTSAGVPPDVTSTVLTRERYSFWRDVCLGFRFDVDLNDCLCSFGSGAPGDIPSISNISTNALHVYALCFDGRSDNGYVPHAFGQLYTSYVSRFWFSDSLQARADPVLAGADGGVIPDDEVPLAILADQSGRMAGDGTFVDRPVKRSKAAHGFYNFAPRAGDAMLFEDDPEFARLQRRKGDSRSRVAEIIQRRFKSQKYDDNEDFNAREGDRGGKRGKY